MIFRSIRPGAGTAPPGAHLGAVDRGGGAHLRPDVVFTGRTPPVQQRLQALGLHVVEVDALTIIESALRKIDKALQLHTAEIAIKNMRRESYKK